MTEGPCAYCGCNRTENLVPRVAVGGGTTLMFCEREHDPLSPETEIDSDLWEEA